MEARPDDLYGNSLRLVIPRLEIKNLSVKNSVSPSCFSGIEPLTLSAPQSEETDRGRELNDTLQTYPEFIVNVQANEVIILMINSFVDFFIQYYCPEYKIEQNPLILKLKEIIFYSTNTESLTARDYDTLVIQINHELEAKYPAILSPPSETYFFPKNTGREFLHDPDRIKASKERLEALTHELREGATQTWHRDQLQAEVDYIKSFLDILSKDELFIIYATKFQKFEIFSLLFLSYHVLSTSGFFFTIEIKDLDEILLQEIERTPSSSFILQFLPHDRIIINIIKTNLLQFFMRYSEIYMPALRALRDAPELQRLRAADAGGSKRLHNRSRKNKYKRKYNHKYKKSRKNKHSRRYRRKRMQSNQNKMF